MRPGMAIGAERDQILFRVFTRMAAKTLVVYFLLVHATAYLTAPVIPLQDFAVQEAVALQIERACVADCH